jgi:hypothetical protein
MTARGSTETDGATRRDDAALVRLARGVVD